MTKKKKPSTTLADQLPLRYRPNEYDDWGFVRANEHQLVAIVQAIPTPDAAGMRRHREKGTDPCRAMAEEIVRRVNIHDELVAELRWLAAFNVMNGHPHASRCQSCSRWTDTGHADDCRLMALIAKATA